MLASRRSDRLFVVPMFLLGVCSAIGYLDTRTPIGGGGETVAIALSLTRTGTYGNPFLTLPTGPTAAIVPGYPLFLAFNMALFGIDFHKGVSVVMFALHGLHPVLLLLCAKRAFGSIRPGVWAGGLGTLLPVFRFLPAWDSMMTADGLMLFYLLFSRANGENPGTARVIGPGFLAGALVLLNASSALVIIAFLALDCTRRASWPAVRGAVGILGISGLCLLPWIIRNERVLGSAVVKDNFGFTAYASNNDCAQPALNQMFRCLQEHHGHGSRAEAEVIVQKGEIAYDQYRFGSALEWVRSHPRRFATLTALRVIAFWMPDPSGGPFHWSVWPVTLLSALGLWRLTQMKQPIASEMALVFLIYPLMYYLIVADTRYRYPIMWLSLLAAGFACDHLWNSLKQGRRRSAVAPGAAPKEIAAASR